MPPGAAALIQVRSLVSAKMRKLSSRTVKVTAGRFVRDILLKGSAASWPNVFPFLWLLFKETAVFIRRLRSPPTPDMSEAMRGSAAAGGCLARRRSDSGRDGPAQRVALPRPSSRVCVCVWGVFEWNDLEMFPEIAFVCPFRSREDEPVGHGFHFVPCRAFYFSFNPPKKKKINHKNSPSALLSVSNTKHYC